MVVNVPLRLLRQPRREAARVHDVVVAARRGHHVLVAQLVAKQISQELWLGVAMALGGGRLGLRGN